MIRRHWSGYVVRLPDPPAPMLLPLDRPVSLVDVLKRHLEWRRRLELTLIAKRDGQARPDFPLLHYCVRCDHEFSPRTRPPFYLLCPRCRPLQRSA